MRRGAEKTYPDLVEHIKSNYQGQSGLILGLSYSANGICEKDLSRPFFNCSWSGLDMYYNVRLCEYMQDYGLLANVEVILNVFPYYYFDYDMSKSRANFELGSLFPIRQLNDWHHYRDVPGAYEYVENIRIFGSKISQFYRAPKWTLSSFEVFGGADGSFVLDPLWFTDYRDTTEELADLFLHNLLRMKEKGKYSYIVVPPFYLRALDYASKCAFQKKKEKFYRILSNIETKAGEIKIFDFSDVFDGRRELFCDLTHLNCTGASEFTKLLNREILGS